MAQLDSLIILPLFWSLILVIIFYYFVSIKNLIPYFFENKKMKNKKISLLIDFYSESRRLKSKQLYRIF